MFGRCVAWDANKLLKAVQGVLGGVEKAIL
jgi:hypothetical protein